MLSLGLRTHQLKQQDNVKDKCYMLQRTAQYMHAVQKCIDFPLQIQLRMLYVMKADCFW